MGPQVYYTMKYTIEISIKMVQIKFQKTSPLCSQSIFVQCECVSYLRTICFYAYRKQSLISKPKFTQIRIRLLYNELSEAVEAVKSNNNFVTQKWSLDLCSKKAF